MNILIVYRTNEGSGASLSTEKGFTNYKSMSQFIRRNKVLNPSIYYSGQLVVLIGNKYLPVYRLGEILAKCISNETLNNK